MSLLEDLVCAYRILAHHGVIDAYGHVSVRSEANPGHYFLARSLAPELVRESDIMEYDLDSVPLEDGKGTALRESVRERFIHGEVYKARPEVKAVVHNHSPTVVPFSVTGVPMRALFHMAAFAGEGLPVFEIRAAQQGTDLLVKTPYLGQALARTLGGKPAALMRGHGAVVVGDSLSQVVGRSYYLQMNAKLQAQAMALGGEVTYLDTEEARKTAGFGSYDRAWDLWKRKAMGK
jgi:ribulose-5-phosphate 4-epimerase/fuculose-1-phosphate aldolase